MSSWSRHADACIRCRPGSPTIRVDGEDLIPVPEGAGYALGCRMYATQEGLRYSPTAEMVRESLAERNLVPRVS